MGFDLHEIPRLGNWIKCDALLLTHPKLARFDGLMTENEKIRCN